MLGSRNPPISALLCSSCWRQDSAEIIHTSKSLRTSHSELSSAAWSAVTSGASSPSPQTGWLPGTQFSPWGSSVILILYASSDIISNVSVAATTFTTYSQWRWRTTTLAVWSTGCVSSRRSAKSSRKRRKPTGCNSLRLWPGINLRRAAGVTGPGGDEIPVPRSRDVHSP